MAQKILLFPLFLACALSRCASFANNQWGGDGKVVQTAVGLCLEMTPESRDHRVAICESPDQKSFTVIAPGRAPLAYQKSMVQSVLRERIAHLLSGTVYPKKDLYGATVELWVVAPVFAPEDVYFSAFVQARGGNFSVRLPLEPRSWAPHEGDVALLGTEAFPSRAARRAGKVVVTARPHVNDAEFTAFLAASGLSGRSLGGMVEVATGAFGEERAARTLLKARQATYFVQSVELEAAGEKDGAKARALAFPLSGR